MTTTFLLHINGEIPITMNVETPATYAQIVTIIKNRYKTNIGISILEDGHDVLPGYVFKTAGQTYSIEITIPNWKAVQDTVPSWEAVQGNRFSFVLTYLFV